jgi:hypothetical protein
MTQMIEQRPPLMAAEGSIREASLAYDRRRLCYLRE